MGVTAPPSLLKVCVPNREVLWDLTETLRGTISPFLRLAAVKYKHFLLAIPPPKSQKQNENRFLTNGLIFLETWNSLTGSFFIGG